MNSLLFPKRKSFLIVMFFCSLMTFSQEESIDVPFAILEEIPQFPNCKDMAYENEKNCFMQEMNNHIKSNFRYPTLALKKNIQGRITVMFVINSKGYVSNIKAHVPEGCEILAKEAIRIIKLLPKFKPGMQKGKPVGVSYAQPIMFKLQ